MKTLEVYRNSIRSLLAAGTLAIAGSATAATITVDTPVVSGTIFNDPVTIDYLQFGVDTPGTVTIDVLSYSVLGGDGFGFPSPDRSALDSQIRLFAFDGAGDLGMLGAQLASNDDSLLSQGQDGSTDQRDSYLAVSLQPGRFVLAISDFNFSETEARAGVDDGFSGFLPGTFGDYQVTFTGIDVSAVPLPAGLPLLLGGLGALGVVRRRRAKRTAA